MAIDGTNRGKPKYIESPEKMYSLFKEYEQDIRSHPLTMAEQKKGNLIVPKNFEGKLTDISLIELPLRRALTLEGFENYCAKMNIIEDLSQYFANSEGRYSNYQTICARIRREIRQDQLEGGLAGIYNPSITQRLNGLVDKVENTTISKLTIEYEDMNEAEPDEPVKE